MKIIRMNNEITIQVGDIVRTKCDRYYFLAFDEHRGVARYVFYDLFTGKVKNAWVSLTDINKEMTVSGYESIVEVIKEIEIP